MLLLTLLIGLYSFFVAARSDVTQDNREAQKRSYEQLFGRSQQTYTGGILEERSGQSRKDGDH